MPVPIAPEPASWRHEPAESCCICHRKTRTRHTGKDVALCAECAETVAERDLPTKEQWFATANQQRAADLRQHHLPSTLV